MSNQKNESKKTSNSITGIFAVVAALAGALAVYGFLAPPGNAPIEAESNKPAATSRATNQAGGEISDHAPSAPSKKLNRGRMAGFVYKKSPSTLAKVSFVDAEGSEKSMADWRGKVVLLNLWATWCAPCREEMPALDRLNKELSSDKFEVVALSIDRSGLDLPRSFLKKIGIETLQLYNDKTSRSANKLKAYGMPTTILIDRNGLEIGRLAGPAHWDSEEAFALVKAAIGD